MNHPSIRTLIVTILLQAASFGQGSLTPPLGPPEPSMKSMSEIYGAIAGVKDDERTPIHALPYAISQPGSYYLAGSLSVSSGAGIAISTSNVTLDLNGFTISSTLSGIAGSGYAIFISANVSDVRIRNGNIESGTTVSGGVFAPNGFLGGIGSPSSANQSIHVSDLRIKGIGGSGILIDSASFSIVENCFVSVCDGPGIKAHTVNNSFATGCRNTAINAYIVSNSRGQSIGTSAGSNGISAAIVSNCFATSLAGTGISSGGTVSNCRATRDGGVAIQAGIAIGCTVYGSGTVISSQKHLGTP
ncbi:MAG: right-handed parallel beta-helix repeat-containing protein [Verrucomicrobiae bacterium]|nr:right-handed parallel beta-helix repeat-containing protein [Verrucomicrobiae bacterium]